MLLSLLFAGAQCNSPSMRRCWRNLAPSDLRRLHEAKLWQMRACRFKAVALAPLAIVRGIVSVSALLFGWAVCSLVLIGDSLSSPSLRRASSRRP